MESVTPHSKPQNSKSQRLQAPKPALVLGFPVHLLPDYVSWLLDRLDHRQGTHVVTLNAEMTMQARQERKLATVIRQADLVIPDGAGIVLYLKARGETVRRCPGIELSETLLQQAGERTVFFYGGAPGVAEDAARILQGRYPGLNIVGTQDGYVNEQDMPLFLERLRSLSPQLIYVGLGVPRQEHWIAAHRHIVPNAVWIGVGGSFDIWGNRKERAPEWLRNNHLEWTYRLYQEPWRWKRMLALPRFAWQAFLEFFSSIFR
ncbi:MAG: WecB/TagA/CpsF family glycosyltransferase [Thermosynechococcaceae cyanobacterium MS004]|nr:WecB/TagA/CpsF family glycosyltransferase [Thermosynechococcaceae cyanobacterium MS004]